MENGGGQYPKANQSLYKHLFLESFDAHDALGDVITLYRIFFSYKLVLLVEWLVNKSSLMSVEDPVEDINYLDSCHHQLMSFCGKLYNCSGLKVFACSDTELGKILFHFILFCDRENKGKISAQPHTSLYIHIWGFIIQCITSKMYMHN